MGYRSTRYVVGDTVCSTVAGWESGQGSFESGDEAEVIEVKEGLVTETQYLVRFSNGGEFWLADSKFTNP
jgi:hypothetical protein